MIRSIVRRPTVGACALAALFACSGAAVAHDRTPPPTPQVACESLAALSLPNTEITLAQSVPAGVNASPVGTIPRAICRVAGTVAPEIKFEVWMPSADWNGSFEGVPLGGLAGA